jgi:hypothetical protein
MHQAKGSLQAIVARLPESANLWCRFTCSCRAIQVAQVPLSLEMMALGSARSDTNRATVSGLIGVTAW